MTPSPPPRPQGGDMRADPNRTFDLNNLSGKWSTAETLVNTVPWWKLLGEELWQGVGPPLGELSCNQGSHWLKDYKSLHTNPYFACGYTAQVPSAVSGTVLGIHRCAPQVRSEGSPV